MNGILNTPMKKFKLPLEIKSHRFLLLLIYSFNLMYVMNKLLRNKYLKISLIQSLKLKLHQDNSQNKNKKKY